jgi:uracil-DNA glycosylase
MSTPLQLDPRRRAMLREMGVRIWQPSATPPDAQTVPQQVAINSGAARAHNTWAAGQKGIENSVQAADLTNRVPPVARSDSARSAVAATDAVTPNSSPASSPAAAPASSASPASRRATASTPRPAFAAAAAGAAPCWQTGEAVTLFETGHAASGTRWLVLAETPAASLRAGAFDPLAGDIGLLLGNMLRAARLPQAALAQLVPLARVAAGGAPEAALQQAIAGWIDAAQPGIVLIMGRLAAQAVLGNAAPLGKLRGQVHDLHGTAAVVTYDAAFLLRNPQDKAKAWSDLQLAMACVRVD